MDLSSDFSRVSSFKGPLYQKLMALRLPMAQAAQKVYDAWYQDEDGHDEMYGRGGICGDIADAIVGVIYDNIPGVLAGGVNPSCGENHVWTMVCLEQEERGGGGDDDDEDEPDNEGYVVDIPYYVYETGGGYHWTKIKGVEFSAADITLSFIHSDDVRANLEYEG